MSTILSIIINTRDRKEMLLALLKSIYSCNLPFLYEIIIVDDCSVDDYTQKIKEKCPQVKFIRNKSRLFLIKSRNKGWHNAEGEFIFFIDDDNEIKDQNFFIKALKLFKEDSQIGVLGCITYYFDNPKYVLAGPNEFNMYTGKTSFAYINQEDNGEISGKIKVHNTPNAFFSKLEYLKKVNGFSDEIVQTYSEADYCEKLKKIGFGIYQHGDLKVYHKSEMINYKKMSTRTMGGSPERIYYLMRNKFLFIKKYGSFAEKVIFTLFFSHLYNVYYLFNLLRVRQFEMAKMSLWGIFDGYFFMLSGKLNNYYEKKSSF